MSPRARFALGSLLLVVACGPGGAGQRDGAVDADADATDADAIDAASTTIDAAPMPIDAPPASCTPTVTPAALVVGLAGRPARVWDHASRAEPNNVTDARPTPYRTADGRAHLMLTHFENYRISGADLDSLAPTPQSTYRSSDHAALDQASYGYHQWIMAPYSDDGTHFFALAHSEWYGCLPYGADPVRGCAVGQNQIASWVNGVTLFGSDDGGATWAPRGAGPAHVVLAPPPPYPGWSYWTAPSPLNFGMFHPSNIVKADGAYYALIRYTHRVGSGAVDAAGLVLARTTDLARADGWQVWTGGATFAAPTEPLISLPGSASWDHASVTFNTALCRYLIVYFDYADRQLYYTTTASLAAPALDPPRPLAGQEYVLATPGAVAPGFGAANYAHLVDPAWPGFNFEGSGAAPYLYFGTFDPARPIDRDVYRAPLVVSAGPYVPVPLPEGLFMIGDGIYYANAASAYCVFPDWATYVRITGRTDVVGVPRYGSVPSSMTNHGVCQG
jgi:hypothetical protein